MDGTPQKITIDGKVIEINRQHISYEANKLVLSDNGTLYPIIFSGTAYRYISENLRLNDYLKVQAEVGTDINQQVVLNVGDIESILEHRQLERFNEPLRTQEFVLRGKVQNLSIASNITMEIVDSFHHVYPININRISDVSCFIESSLHNGDYLEVIATLNYNSTSPNAMNLSVESEEDIIKHSHKE